MFKNSNIDVPCLNCKRRTITCHAECDEYKRYTELLREFNRKCATRRHIDKLTNPTNGFTWDRGER